MTFGELKIYQSFTYDGAHYIKIEPTVVALNTVINAEEIGTYDDPPTGIWLDDDIDVAVRM